MSELQEGFIAIRFEQICVCMCVCEIEDFLGRAKSFEKSLKKNSEGKTDEGDLHLNVQQIFITLYQILSIRICICICSFFNIHCLRIKIIFFANKIRSKKWKTVLNRSIFKAYNEIQKQIKNSMRMQNKKHYQNEQMLN